MNDTMKETNCRGSVYMGTGCGTCLGCATELRVMRKRVNEYAATKRADPANKILLEKIECLERRISVLEAAI